MTKNAGERLFLAIGHISDDMILEADRERLTVKEETVSKSLAMQEPDPNTKSGTDTEEENEGLTSADTDGNEKKRIYETRKRPIRNKEMINAGKYLKYLPVAACLCIVLGSAGYIIHGFMQAGSSDSMSIRSAVDQSADQTDDSSDNGMEMAMDQNASTGNAEQDEEISGSSDGSESGYTQNQAEDIQEGIPQKQKELFPICYDAYQGPVFPLTATGDTQKLKVSRNLKGIVATDADGMSPYLRVTDVYKIKNTSGHDKTLQLVYPFVSTMNRTSETNEEILEIQGGLESDQTVAAYSMGESVLAYRNADMSETSAMSDYQKIFNEQTDYQEQALAKEADWNQKVTVYNFSDVLMQEETSGTGQPLVFGVTIKGTDAAVLTYGFDHSFANENSDSNHCFFVSEEQKKRVLIVTGEQEGDPVFSYYTNLDCEEKIDGPDYEITGQEMTYTDALRLCSNDAARKLRQDYERGVIATEFPDYMNEDAAFRVLTMISEEDRFYDTLLQRYQSVELSEIFERLFGETRVVYARATVTIPARKTIRVTVHIQKRQKNTMDAGTKESDAETQQQYDFFPGMQSHLQIVKTSVSLQLKEEWQLAGQNLGLTEKQKQIWKADALDQAGFVIVKYGKMEEFMDES